MPNRLARERSPYLLQHANNPVDWFAWGEEAFTAARQQNKPIFLSIGYATCHWCHVMEHESFEDEAIARLLNDHFISIKLDREERPDIDRVYMTFVQATTGAGGWPMSVWLTPDLKPFFGGTYFPPVSKWGRPGFTEVLGQLARAWEGERTDVLRSAEEMTERLRDATGSGRAEEDRAPVARRDAIDAGVASFAQSFDARSGGFGGAPKFPRPSELLFLFDAWALTADPKARQMAVETLRAMAVGGLRDHVGGGFHRYSVDGQWRVPHFEKMLYDQAQLVLAYLAGAQVNDDPLFAAVAEDTIDYVRRDLTAPDGAFFSAEDADSLPTAAATEMREGAFYAWSAAEIDRLFGADATVIRRRFGIEDAGNAPADPHGEFAGLNILHIAQPIDDVATRSGQSVEEVMRILAEGRQRMFDARAERPRPRLDDKVLTAWNGMMIAACARASRVLADSPRRDEWREMAVRAATAVRTLLWSESDRRLLRRYRDGEAAVDAFCEDYACLIWGLIELVQATGDAAWLEWARVLLEEQTARFFDERDGGWFSTTGTDPSVLLRLKEDYDGAEPAAASVTVRNLLALGHLLNDASLTFRAQRTLERYGPQIGRVTRVMPLMVANVAHWHGRFGQIVLVGDRDTDAFAALERAAARVYYPWSVTLPVPSAGPSAALAAQLPWLAAMRAAGGHATAFVCHDFTCQAPVTTPEALAAQITDAAAPRRIV